MHLLNSLESIARFEINSKYYDSFLSDASGKTYDRIETISLVLSEQFWLKIDRRK